MSDIKDRLDAIQQRADAATPGVWKLWGMRVLADQDGTGNVDTAVPVADSLMLIAGSPRTFDAVFIAHARQDVPALVGALRAVLDHCAGISETWDRMVSAGYGSEHRDGQDQVAQQVLSLITDALGGEQA